MRRFSLFLAVCMLLSVTAFADGYQPEDDISCNPQTIVENDMVANGKIIPRSNYLNFTYNGWESSNGWFTADIVLLYNEAYDRFERLVSFNNFDSEFYDNIIVQSRDCTFSNGKQTATITVKYSAQDRKTKLQENGETIFTVNVWN